jgi:hypothetical protein
MTHSAPHVNSFVPDRPLPRTDSAFVRPICCSFTESDLSRHKKDPPPGAISRTNLPSGTGKRHRLCGTLQDADTGPVTFSGSNPNRSTPVR